MTEAYYQKKLMTEIEEAQGVVVNGRYTKRGEADLQAGLQVVGSSYLAHIAIEVKTPSSYEKVMKGIIEKEDGLYHIVDIKKLREHEVLQVHKINRNRKLGGLALFAYSYKQVEEYLERVT